MSFPSNLAAIYGSEQDKVNCSFYLKIGACRHGDRCSRKHIKPTFSQTIVIQNMFQNPNHTGGGTGQLLPGSGTGGGGGSGIPGANGTFSPSGNGLPPKPGENGGIGNGGAAAGGGTGASLSKPELQNYFDSFYEDVWCELVKFGNLLEMHVCDNVGDHLIGNVYARYDWEDEAQEAVDALNRRWYAGRPLFVELSPVTDFREACCRQNDMGECNRGGFCNFMHIQEPSHPLLRELVAGQRVERRINPNPKDIQRALEMGIPPPGQEGHNGFGGGGGMNGNGMMGDRDRERERERERRPRDRDRGDRGDRGDRDRERERHRDRDEDRGGERRHRSHRGDRDRDRDRGERSHHRDRSERDRERGESGSVPPPPPPGPPGSFGGGQEEILAGPVGMMAADRMIDEEMAGPHYSSSASGRGGDKDRGGHREHRSRGDREEREERRSHRHRGDREKDRERRSRKEV